MDRKRDWAGAWLLPLLVAVGYGLFVKYRLLDTPLGFSAVARLLSRVDASQLSLLERLALFRADLLLGCLVLPLAALALGWRLGRRGRLLLALGLGLVVAFAGFFGREAVANVGRFLTADMAADAWHWVFEHPENLIDYARTAHWPALLVCLAGMGLAAVWAWRAETRAQRLPGRLVLALMTAGVLAGGLGFLAGLPALPQARGLLPGMAGALIGKPPGALKAELGDAELPGVFRALTRTPPRDDHAPAFGRERGANVLVFVMETGPRRALDLAEEIERQPTLRRLAPHALVSSRHYTTYPYTSDALFSLLGGVYPLYRKSYLRAGSEAAPFGLMAALAASHRTRVYTPDRDSFEADLTMFRVLGARDRYVAEDVPFSAQVRARAEAEMAALPQDSTAFTKFRRFTERRFLRDRALLEQVKQDIADDRAAGRRFCSVVLPQIGHAPWLNLINSPDILARGRDLMLRQLAWLDELVDFLERGGDLANTVILVTADHGIRTRGEDPGFRAGSVSAYSFNVPLLIYAPHTIAGPDRLEVPTSHIDLTPTILSLLGVREGRDQEQGVPVWQAGLDKRVLGLFAGDYLGADAYLDNGVFFMREAFTGAAYRSPTLEFGGQQMLAPADAEQVGERIDTWYALQARWRALSR